jgi:hypothetical protein
LIISIVNVIAIDLINVFVYLEKVVLENIFKKLSSVYEKIKK